VDIDKAAKEHWHQQQNQQQRTSIHFAGESWHIFMENKKMSTNLKYQLLEHTAGQVAQTYWAGKKCFRDSNIQQVDWTAIEMVITSKTINMRQWTTKFATGFCATGC